MKSSYLLIRLTCGCHLIFLAFIAIANELLDKCNLPGKISRLGECSVNFFVGVYKGLLGDDLPGKVNATLTALSLVPTFAIAPCTDILWTRHTLLHHECLLKRLVTSIPCLSNF